LSFGDLQQTASAHPAKLDQFGFFDSPLTRRERRTRIRVSPGVSVQTASSCWIGMHQLSSPSAITTDIDRIPTRTSGSTDNSGHFELNIDIGYFQAYPEYHPNGGWLAGSAL
jgi:hypothetical protein